MRTTKVLAIVAILGIAFSFRASAKVAYDSETTNEWFRADVSSYEKGTPPWSGPNEGEAVVKGEVLDLDTDFNDPLTYTATETGNVVLVTAKLVATANATAPELDLSAGSLQAALSVVGTDTETNWVGLVGGAQDPSWETFTSATPAVGTEYTINIEIDNHASPQRIRYSVGGVILKGEGSADGWYVNPKSGASKVNAVSFAGAGTIGDFGGDVITENGATFDGVGYATFEDALAAAKAAGSDWSDSNPIVLYKNAAYNATETCVLYVNPNGKAFTVNGEVVTKTSGFTYTITTKTDCEAFIDSTYYATFDDAVEVAGADDVIVVNNPLTKDLAITKSLGVNPDGKLTCAALTVGSGVVFNLAGNLSVGTATVGGSVTGEGVLTVTGTLTGTAIAKLTLGDNATFAYADAALGSSTTLTLGAALKISGLGSATIDTVVIDNAAVSGKSVSMFTADPALPTGLMLAVDGDVLKVVKEPPAIAIEIDEDTAGFDYTNGTVNVKTTVRSGASGVLKLTVYDFDGTAREVVTQNVDGSTTNVSWNLDNLTAGGIYSYEIVINDGSEDVGIAYGEFAAANWGDVWFGADASKATDKDRVTGGEWATEPKIENNAYVIEEDSVFNVKEQELGSNRVTRVDAAVTFESLVDGDVDTPEDGAISGFVATTAGWQALAANGWTILTGGPAPVAGKPYIVRAEVDFISNPKRVRYLVSEDGATFIPLANGTTQWLALADETKSLLAKVELQGSGKVAKFEATVADKAIARVGKIEYDTMDEALKAAGTNGTEQIELLTNATIEPTEKGKYEIAPGDYWYVSGGKVASGDRTIIIDEPGQPPVVRPTDKEMQKVKTPDGNSYKDYDSLRKFLEKNKVEGYTDDDADAQSVSNALEKVDEANTLQLWQDYALGIDVGTSVAPVTIPTGDTATDGITLAIPAVDPAKYSGDYDITYKVEGEAAEYTPQAIKIPLGTGTYSIKAVFTPKTEPENTESAD